MTNDEAILSELQNQTMWLKAIWLQAVKDAIKKELKSKQDKNLFELSDGKSTTREIAKAVGVSHKMVADKWDKWASLGLVVQGEKFTGRFKSIATLSDLGIK